VALGNLAQRFLVAVVAVPILLGILYVQRPEPTWALIFIASLIAMHEFFAMTLPAEDRKAAVVLGGIACLVFYWLDPATLALYSKHLPNAFRGFLFSGSTVALLFAVVVPMLYFLFKFRDIPSVATRTTATVMGIVYAGFLTTFLAKLKVLELTGITPPGRGYLVLTVLLIAWLADTGGYFAGRTFGKAKLYAAVSPGKTWAGAWGGLAGSFAGVALLKLFFAEYLTWVDVALLAIPGGMLGQMGDLAESLIKRSTGVKDSGALLPGHGGILDRIDAVLFIAPYVYVYLTLRFPAGF
jgi:phosphatidate cytidylyltransferase